MLMNSGLINSNVAISDHAIQRFRERWPRIRSGPDGSAKPLDNRWTDVFVRATINRLLHAARPEDMGKRGIHRLLNNMSSDGRISDTAYYVNAGARMRFVVVNDEREGKQILVTVEVAGDDVRWLNNVSPTKSRL